jgi:menaquinone-dependent protoporphyrinogen oxidase
MRVVVTAASKHGSTEQIAERIADVLSSRGHRVDLTPPDHVDPGAYDAVVLGSAVYAGHWMPSAKALVERAGEALSTRPTWLFSSGPIGMPPTPDEDPVDVEAMMRATGAREHRVFAGRLEKSLLSFPERAIVAALHAPMGDFRDWGQIEGWASSIADVLGPDRATVSG